MNKEQEKKAVHSAIDAGEIPSPEEISRVMSWLSKKNKMTKAERVARAKKAGIAGALKRWGK